MLPCPRLYATGKGGKTVSVTVKMFSVRLLSKSQQNHIGLNIKSFMANSLTGLVL